MQNSFRNNSFGGSRSGGRRPGGRDSGGDREMFDAVCVNCGNNCKVPFRPTSGKPIYCSDCFESVEKDRDNGDFSRPQRRNNFDRPQYDRTRNDRPNFPRREAPAPTVNLDALTQKMDEMNEKLDLLLHSLTHKSEE